MNKFYLIKHPDLFQGEKYLKSDKNYFEGWYFKTSNSNETISFIPGINVDGNKKAFVQVITNDSSYFIDYDIKDFDFKFDPFFIRIGKNTFSKDKVHIDINENIKGDIEYSNSQNINSNIISPNIMGPFSYVPFMECNHAILCMKNVANGVIKINNHNINFNNDNGYIEKDWGYSFPKSYIWCQGNSFKNSNASFMLSIADIPFKVFDFRGIICVLIVENTEFRFTTYNNTKLLKYDISKDFFDIILQKGEYSLNVKSQNYISHRLSAPVKGKMEKYIFESVSSLISITLKKNNDVIFSDSSTNCGLEIVQK